MWNRLLLPLTGRKSGRVGSIIECCLRVRHGPSSQGGGPLLALFVGALVSCRAQPSEPHFPSAHREVAPIVGGTFSTEDARDRLGEA